MNQDPRRSSSRKHMEESSRQSNILQQEIEIRRQQLRAQKLQKVREEELRVFTEEAIELSRLVDIYEEESASETIVTNLGPNQVEDTQSIGPGIPSNQSHIPLPTVDPEGALTFGTRNLAGRPRSVSTEINRVEWGNLSAISPERSNFDQNIFCPQTIEEEVFVESGIMAPMEEDMYKEILKKAKLYKRQMKSLIDTFTPEKITNSLQKDTYHGELRSIKDSFVKVSNWFDTLIIDLEENDEQDRINEIEAILNEIKQAKDTNELLVQQKMAQVLAEDENNKPPDPKEQRKKEELKAKMKIKKSFVEEKCRTLTQKVLVFKKAKEMSNDEVRFALKESRNWERKLEQIVNGQQSFYEECVPLDDVEDDKNHVSERVCALTDAITSKINSLSIEDEERGLNCMAENKSKDTVVFPAVFKGDLGDNVYKFVADFKEAVTEAQIKKSDQVKTLQKYLGGEAKKRCGDHYPDLESALEALTEFYGNATLIWVKTKNELESSFSNLTKEWGDYGDPARVTAIAKVIEFLRQSESLAKEYTELKTEVFSSSTLSLLRRILPRDYIEKVNDTISDVSATSEQKMTKIKQFLEKKKTSALMGVESLKSVPVRVAKTQRSDLEFGRLGIPPRDTSFRDPLGARSLTSPVASVSVSHSCLRNPSCKQDWGLLGCSELYKLDTVDDRRSYCKEAKCCFRCGITLKPGDFKPSNRFGGRMSVNHRCDWKSDKMVARCIISGCVFGAATCHDHQDNSNTSKELLDWLQSKKIRHNLFAVPNDSRQSKRDRNRKRKLCSDHDFISDEELTKKLKQKLADELDGCADAVHPIPAGDGIFMFTVMPSIEGDPLQVFMDTGANSFLMRDGIEKKLVTIKAAHGPIPMSVAGGLQINASGEYGALIPLADGTHQSVRGLCLQQVVGRLPQYNLRPILSQIREDNPENKKLNHIKIPKRLGGEVDILLGIRYLRIMPKPIHHLPCGLTVFESCLKPFNRNETAVLGGPVEALESIANAVNTKGLIRDMVVFCSNLRSFKPTLEFFPPNQDQSYMMGKDVPFASADLQSEVEQTPSLGGVLVCDICQVISDPAAVSNTAVQAELLKFLKMQEAGLDVSYRCRRCRECQVCKGGAVQEKLSLRQEAEQELVRESIQLDLEKGEATAKLPFIQDPNEKLVDNRSMAKKRLDSIINKYRKEPELKEGIMKAWAKMIEKGHLKFDDQLLPEEKEVISQGVSYWIPWNVSFKDSLSTPIRPVFDASASTPSGFSLNSIIAKGIPDLVKLLALLLAWQMGVGACVGDISQFYPTIKLVVEHWRYQRVLLRENLEPDGRLIQAVITKLIFGVLSVSSLSEEVIRKFAEHIKEDYPEVYAFLIKYRYVDDLGRSTRSREEAHAVADLTSNLLEKFLNMKIKGGWSFAGSDPPEEVSKDGATVEFGGHVWYPKLDVYRLNIPSLYFGKKKRGKVPSNIEIYNGSMPIEDFTPAKITRRQCAGVVARVWDIMGKVAPVLLKLRHDLRRLIVSNPEWDSPLTMEIRASWIDNFKIIEDLRDIMYVRCSIPEDALRTTARILIQVDAADVGIMIAAYIGYERQNGTWSCSHLLGKGLLAPEQLTLPQKELQGLSNGADVHTMLSVTLGEWIEESAVFCDSEISLCWVSYETIKLNVFNRNRVVNITRQVSLDNLYHLQGKENCADTGTRVKKITAQSVRENSEWLLGRPWMQMSLKNATEKGVIKPIKDIKLSHEKKRVLKEGIIFDGFEDDPNMIAVVMLAKVNTDKIAEREALAGYIYSPTKRNFASFVRITSLVLEAVRIFKLKLMKKKIRNGQSQPSELESLSLPPQRFFLFCANTSNNSQQEPPLPRYTAKGVPVYESAPQEVSAGLEYIFRTESKLIKHFNNDKKVKEISVEENGILYAKTRLMEAHELDVVGGIDASAELLQVLGANFKVPLVEKHSPIVLPLILHLHRKFNHRGTESTYRLSLEKVKIIEGKPLFKLITNDCVLCKIKRKQLLQQIMGPVSKYQTSVTPIFFYCLVDMWGPLSVYAPGYEKSTRSTAAKKYKAYFLIFVCAVTGMCNVQLIEGKDTPSVLDGCTRFFNETTVPKIMLPDDDGAFIRAFTRGEISLSDISGHLYREKGILFEICPPQGHSAHGKAERKIRSLQDSLSQSEIKNSRCTATGWMTIGKAIEHEANDVPLGYLYDNSSGDSNPVLRLLRPNSLKGFGLADRAPKGMFTIPNSPKDMMTKISDLFNMWYKFWATSYLPLLLERPKWKVESDSLKPNDIIYFKILDSALGATWKLGKVEQVKEGKDGNVREIIVAYKILKDRQGDVDSGWRHNTVVRPVRECIKLFEIDETTFGDNMKEIREKAEQILNKRKDPECESVPVEELLQALPDVQEHDSEIVPVEEVLEAQSDVPELENKKEDDKLKVLKHVKKYFEDCRSQSRSQDPLSCKPRPKKSEVEKLKIDNKEFLEEVSGPRKRKAALQPFHSCSSVSEWNKAKPNNAKIADDGYLKGPEVAADEGLGSGAAAVNICNFDELVFLI